MDVAFAEGWWQQHNQALDVYCSTRLVDRVTPGSDAAGTSKKWKMMGKLSLGFISKGMRDEADRIQVESFENWALIYERAYFRRKGLENRHANPWVASLSPRVSPAPSCRDITVMRVTHLFSILVSNLLSRCRLGWSDYESTTLDII